MSRKKELHQIVGLKKIGGEELIMLIVEKKSQRVL